MDTHHYQNDSTTANNCSYNDNDNNNNNNNNNDEQCEPQKQPQPLPSQNVDHYYSADIVRDTMRTNKLNKKWNRRLKFFFCCLGYKKNKDSFADVASIFADFFHDLESTSSTEFVAGFVTLAKFQEAQREWMINNSNDDTFQYLSCLPVSSKTKFLNVSEADDSHLLNELIYYMNYSLAIFGWPLQVLDDPCMLCCIYPYLRISPCCGKSKKKNKNKSKANTEAIDEKVKKEPTCDQQTTPTASNSANGLEGASKQETNNITPKESTIDVGSEKKKKKKTKQKTVSAVEDYDDTPIIIDDNCCSCNAASVERRLAVHNYEIIYVTYHVGISRIPFLVAADHSKQTIVVSMRGSMSLEDVVTDMNGQIDKLPIKNCPDNWLCHRGISRASNYVKTKLIEEGILQRAFNCRPDLGSQDYHLVLCGHSLGAGAAAILGILMRDQYPSLKAYLYSPPGGLLSLPVVEYTKQFATSIILGNDCVPRLGVAQVERLRYQVYLSLKNAQQSPSKIITKTFCPSCCCSKKTKTEYDPQTSVDLLHGSHGSSFEFKGVKIPFQVQSQLLYVPGRILHIVKNYSLQSRATRLFKGPVYQAVWVENTNYDRIMIANGMFCDHLPNHLMHAMKMLFVNTLPVRNNSKTTERCSNLVSSSTVNDTVNRTITTNSSPLMQQKPSIYNSIAATNQPNLTIHDVKQNVIKSMHRADIDNNNNTDNNNNNNNDSASSSSKVANYINSTTDTFKDKNNKSTGQNMSDIATHHIDNNGNDCTTYDRNHVHHRHD